MTEEKVKKREWVKNAAIIFLSIMLVLTFFSNTFMNYSLPEVSTQYVTSGSISAKIRGSGSVTANEEYIVETEQSRKIEAVLVQVGQSVKAGDILFVLGEGDSTELDDAKLALETAEIEYERALIEASREKYTAESEAVYDAREDYLDAKETAENIKKAEAAISSAKTELDEKTAKYNDLKTHLEKLESSEGETEEIKQLKVLLADAQEKLDAWTAERDKMIDTESDEYKMASNSIISWQKAVDDYRAKLAELNVPGSPDPNEYNELYNQYVVAEAAMTEAEEKLDKAEKQYGKYAGMDYDSALEAIEAAEKRYDDAREALSNAIANGEIDEKLEELNLEYEKKNLDRLREKVAELSGGETGNEIVAKVGGTVAELDVKAGETAQAGSRLALIELSDRGYTVNVSVTSEQAKKVSVGDTAEVSTYWWGSQISAVLKEIKNDAQSGGRNKILIFEVSGDVEPGMNVDISIGQRSQNYAAIVPNSAVRSDSNGSFVLALVTKSSPLGNRYSATRIDVQVLASDDVNSAVSGIGNGEYVITTASAPIESGMLVRMAEG
ncbi:MAG: HlyD family efflux transporter periplasmic adaptor subunit [Oscillospiraceae bacterium]|nr:HlyD family efflux transporter periplasmic adaptor subunit [Oscillospiraceae bacterium]